MIAFLRQLPSLLKESLAEWQKDNAMRLSAALSYYTVFSLAPLMLAAIGVAGLIFGDDAASGRVYREVHSVAGPGVAESVQQMVESADRPAAGVLATVLGVAMGLFGASGVFGELNASLNQIWGVKEDTSGGVWAWLKERFLSIGMVMGVCFLLLVSLLANTFLTLVMDRAFKWMPGAEFAGQTATFALSFVFVTALFAAMFRFLPRTPIQWRDVWTGAAFTAFLFTLGKFGLEQYLARSKPSDAYGAAGSLALLLIWVYYSAWIFLFGAEFTKVFSHRMGSRTAVAPPSSLTLQPTPPGSALAGTAAPVAPAYAPAASAAKPPVMAKPAASLPGRPEPGPAPDSAPPGMIAGVLLMAAGWFLSARSKPKEARAAAVE